MASQAHLHVAVPARESLVERNAARLVGGLRRAGELLLETLREIFDENAYQRFLTRRGMAASRASYAEFLEEMRKRRERRVRCC
jgi:hypothetical protein